MQFLIRIKLQRKLELIYVFREIQTCASLVGLSRSDLMGKLGMVKIKVFRPSAKIENELTEIESIEESIPVRAGEDILFALEDQIISDESECVFVSLRCVEDNLVGQIDIESFVFPYG